MTDRFVVEDGRRVVGLAVRAPGGYRFFSSDRTFSRLEGQTFARARTLSNAVAKISRSQRRRIPAGNQPARASF